MTTETYKIYSKYIGIINYFKKITKKIAKNIINDTEIDNKKLMKNINGIRKYVKKIQNLEELKYMKRVLRDFNKIINIELINNEYKEIEIIGNKIEKEEIKIITVEEYQENEKNKFILHAKNMNLQSSKNTKVKPTSIIKENKNKKFLENNELKEDELIITTAIKSHELKIIKFSEIKPNKYSQRCECIISNLIEKRGYIKFYADIDKQFTEKNNNDETEILNKIKEIESKLQTEIFKTECHRYKDGKFKWSFHLFANVCFRSKQHIKQWIINNGYNKLFDMSVYPVNDNKLRMIYAHKDDKDTKANNPCKTVEDIKNYIINDGIKHRIIEVELHEEEILQSHKTNKIKKKVNIINIENALNDLKYIPVIREIMEINDYTIREIREDIIILNLIPAYHICPICSDGKKLSSDNHLYFEYIENKWIKKCRKFEERKLNHFNIDDFPGIKIQNNQFIKYPETFTKKFNFIKSGLGTGKTSNLNKKLKDKKSVLYITCNRSLNHQIIMNDPEIKSYLSETVKHWDTFDKFTVCANSLHKLHRNYNYIVVDEINSLLFNINAGYVKDTKYIMDCLLNKLDSAKQCFFLDFHINSLTKIFLEMISPMDKCDIFYNTYKNTTKKCEVLNIKNWATKLHEVLKNNKRICIFTDSKKKSKYFNEICETYENYKKKILLVNSDNSDSSKLNKKLETEKEYDIIIASPSITVGIDLQSQFDYVFGFYTMFSCNNFTKIQQLNRARQCNQFYIFAADYMTEQTGIMKIKHELENNITPEILNLCKFENCKHKIDINDSYTRYILKIMEFQNNFKCRYSLIRLLREVFENIKIEDNEGNFKESKKILELINTNDEKIKNNVIQMLKENNLNCKNIEDIYIKFMEKLQKYQEYFKSTFNENEYKNFVNLDVDAMIKLDSLLHKTKEFDDIDKMDILKSRGKKKYIEIKNMMILFKINSLFMKPGNIIKDKNLIAIYGNIFRLKKKNYNIYHDGKIYIFNKNDYGYYYNNYIMDLMKCNNSIITGQKKINGKRLNFRSINMREYEQYRNFIQYDNMSREFEDLKIFKNDKIIYDNIFTK